VTVATSIDTRVDSSFALVALADAASEEENEVAAHATLTGVAPSNNFAQRKLCHLIDLQSPEEGD
jgi:hypothetical protein